MRKRTRRRRAGSFLFSPAVFLALLGAAAGAAAQPVTISRFDFSFSNPGARSLGFGGAFAALADDATAAYANPAGLVQLAEPEVSVEARLWNRSPTFVDGGRLEGVPTGRGIDTQQGIIFGRDNSHDFGLSFASVVIPKGRWSFALYGHQLAKFEASATSQGFFVEENPFSIPPGPRLPGSRETVDLEVLTGGLAAAWRMNERVSFGLGIVLSDASLRSRSDAFLWDDDSEPSPYEAISFLPERRISTSTLSVEGTGVTFNAGALWRMSEQVSGGLVYRQGAQVRGSLDFEFGPALPFEGSFRNEAVLEIPDVAGAGLAYRSRDGSVTLATEVDRVAYSGLLRVLDTEEVEVEGVLEYRNAWEVHVGAEYALLRRTPILAFRAGAWIEANRADDLGNGDTTHLSAGLGLAAETFQLDLAGDLSDRSDSISLSFIYNF